MRLLAVFASLTISRLAVSLPAFSQSLTAVDIGKINETANIRRCISLRRIGQYV